MEWEHRRLVEYDFSSYNIEVLGLIMISISSLSFLGGLFVVTSFLSFDRLRSKFAFEQVANMALADMGASFTYFLGAPRGELCRAQAVLQQTFELSSVLWATVIATTLSLAIRHREGIEPKVWRRRIYAYAWVLPFIIALLPLTTRSYGSAGAWCWIRARPRYQSHAWRFSIFYAPVWLAMLYNGYVYAQSAAVLRRLTTIAGDQASAKLEQTIKRLIRYPFILLACWTFPTINRLQQIFGEPIFALYVVTVVTRSSLGLLNALAFGFTQAVKNEWHVWWRSTRFARLGEDDALFANVAATRGESTPSSVKNPTLGPAIELASTVFKTTTVFKSFSRANTSDPPTDLPSSETEQTETETSLPEKKTNDDDDDDDMEQIEL